MQLVPHCCVARLMGSRPAAEIWLRASLELDGGEHTRGRVAALSVAEDLEVLEDRGC
jgi:hypothetical protein